MKIIKKIILGLLVIIAITLIAGFFMQKEYTVKREITINQPKDSVFKFVKFLKNQDKYSVWNKMDPNMKKTASGVDGTVGYIAGWESQNKDLGVGEQEIKKITEGERIDFELRFKVPFEATNKAFMTTETVSTTETKVTWGFEGAMSYPMNIMMPFMNMEKMLGDDLQKGLDDLKVVLETKQL
jgi:Polyketide cyclase / dehydrase and lipid transport